MNYLRILGLTAIMSLFIQCQKESFLNISDNASIQAQDASDQAADVGQACWGQASAIFAQMGEMGKHASEQPNPRLGLRNLARALFEAGVIPDDTMEALGGFVAAELGLTLDACE